MVLSRATARCSALFTHKGVLFNIPKAFLTGKTIRGGDRDRIKPFPYQEKKFNLWYQLVDDTQKRFDENSKIIVVDGPIASGKSTIAKKLADEFEMLYMPQASMDMYYINPYGYDLRQLDPKLPKRTRSFDEKKFCLNPKAENAASFQLNMYYLRFAQYVDALAHVFNTGQGVVLERSPFSDMVFAEAMHKCGYISQNAYDYYYLRKQNTIGELLRPHLVIYLDMPVSRVKEYIKKRGVDYEQNSPALTDKYLQAIDDAYKKKYLSESGVHSELLVYDWSDKGEPEVVLEDAERIDFDKYDKYDAKMKDWIVSESEDWTERRRVYTNEKAKLMCYFRVPCLDCPELLIDAEDGKEWDEVWYSAPGMAYDKGYNEDQGDTNILTKTKYDYRRVFD